MTKCQILNFSVQPNLLNSVNKHFNISPPCFSLFWGEEGVTKFAFSGPACAITQPSYGDFLNSFTMKAHSGPHRSYNKRHYILQVCTSLLRSRY